MKTASARARCSFTLALGAAACLLVAREGRADEPAAVVRFRALEQIVTESEDAAATRATALGVANIVGGAASIGVGSYAAARGSGGPGGGLIGGGGLSLAAGSFVLLSARRDVELETRLRTLEHAENPTEALHQAELAWSQAAERAGKARTRVGVVMMVLGGLLLATGTVAAVANIHLPSSSASLDDRVSFGGALAGVGGTLFAGGAYGALTEDPIESSWRTYSRLTAPDAPAASAWQLQITPTFGPTGAGFVGTF